MGIILLLDKSKNKKIIKENLWMHEIKLEKNGKEKPKFMVKHSYSRCKKQIQT